MVASTSSPVSTPIVRSSNAFTRFNAWTPRLVGIIVGILILGLGNAAMALQRGDRGAEVSDLQSALTQAGCYDGPITGNFGSLTEAGVITCQKKLGLTADGVAGSKTLGMIQVSGTTPQSFQGFTNPTQTATSRENIIQNGSNGKTVSSIQTQLKRLNYYAGSVDGVFGNQTEAAVRAFQQASQLPVDGKVGTQELAALAYRQPVAAATPSSLIALSRNELSLGETNTDVGYLQDALRSAGYFNGNSTQYYGSITRQSVIDFQRSRGLNVTGVADAMTLDSLGLRPGTVAQSLQAPQPWNTGGFTTADSRTNVQSLPSRPASPNFRYVVVVPKQSERTLYQVRRVIGGAQSFSSGKGDYIAAGTYSNRTNAEKRSNYLRSAGFDARVDYQ